MRISMTVALAALIPLGSIATTASRAGDDLPSHVEVEPLKIPLGDEGKLETLAMDARGDLLWSVSWTDETGGRQAAIKIVTPQGKVGATWPLSAGPAKMIHCCPDGVTYLFGEGWLAQYDANGKELKQIQIKDLLDGKFAGAHASGMTASDENVVIALGDGRSLRATEAIVRLRRDLTDPRLIVEQQFGCCAHLDLDVKGDVLLIAENSRHRVNRFSFDGERLGTWGSRQRTDIAGFAACCNPVNFDFGPGGELFTAESGVGRVKRYTAEGEYLGLVGYVDTTQFDKGSKLAAMSCYIPVEVSPDGQRIYVMDVRANFVRVLEKKP